MRAARLVFATVMLGGSALACTVIVNGKLGDKGDYPLAEGGPGTSSGGSSGTSGGAEDPCSLLEVQGSSSNSGTNYRPDNACAQCISKACAPDVEYACNADASDSKPWFTDLTRCAQNPWNGFPAPDSGASFQWGCTSYEKAVFPISDNGSDAERKRASQICVHDRCLTGPTPPCKKCEVAIAKDSTSEKALLRDDPCGKCFLQCEDVLVECCDTAPMDDFIAHCSFTAAREEKEKCLSIGDYDGTADGGNYRGPPGSNSYDAKDAYCTVKLLKCFNDNCYNKDECQPTF